MSKKKSFKKIILIPARSGSKRIKNKNIIKIGKKRLIYYTISQALKIKDIDHVIVSTDSGYYAKVAKKYGAKIFYLRPKKISKDYSSDLDVFRYNEKWLNENLGYYTDIYIHLRPTFPIRKISHISKMIKLMEKNFDKIDSVRSVIKTNIKFEKYYKLNQKNLLKNHYSFKKNSLKQDFLGNQSDHLLNTWYKHNGNIDVFKAKLLNKNTVTGKNILSFLQKNNFDYDINTKKDLANVSKLLVSKNF